MLTKKVSMLVAGAALVAAGNANAEVRQAKRAVEPQITEQDVSLQNAKNDTRQDVLEQHVLKTTKERLAQRVTKDKDGLVLAIYF